MLLIILKRLLIIFTTIGLVFQAPDLGVKSFCFKCGFSVLEDIKKYCCPVNASNSMNIKMFEWYNLHSLDDSPERG